MVTVRVHVVLLQELKRRIKILYALVFTGILISDNTVVVTAGFMSLRNKDKIKHQNVPERRPQKK